MCSFGGARCTQIDHYARFRDIFELVYGNWYLIVESWYISSTPEIIALAQKRRTIPTRSRKKRQWNEIEAKRKSNGCAMCDVLRTRIRAFLGIIVFSLFWPKRNENNKWSERAMEIKFDGDEMEFHLIAFARSKVEIRMNDIERRRGKRNPCEAFGFIQFPSNN